MAAVEGQEDQLALESAAAPPLQEAWSRRRELYEDAVPGVQLVFDILKRRYKTELPNPAKARIKECGINEGKTAIAIVTEDEDDVI